MKLLAITIVLFTGLVAHAGKSVVNKSDGKIVAWQRYGTPKHDAETQKVIDAREPPDADKVRWDESLKRLRNYTPAELVAIKQAKQNADVTREVDQATVQAIVFALKQQFPALDVNQFRTDFISRWKQLQE